MWSRVESSRGKGAQRQVFLLPMALEMCAFPAVEFAAAACFSLLLSSPLLYFFFISTAKHRVIGVRFTITLRSEFSALLVRSPQSDGNSTAVYNIILTRRATPRDHKHRKQPPELFLRSALTWRSRDLIYRFDWYSISIRCFTFTALLCSTACCLFELRPLRRVYDLIDRRRASSRESTRDELLIASNSIQHDTTRYDPNPDLTMRSAPLQSCRRGARDSTRTRTWGGAARPIRWPYF